MALFPRFGMRVVGPTCAQDGSTPAHQAAIFGHTEALQVLIEGRADVNKTNKVSILCGDDRGCWAWPVFVADGADGLLDGLGWWLVGLSSFWSCLSKNKKCQTALLNATLNASTCSLFRPCQLHQIEAQMHSTYCRSPLSSRQTSLTQSSYLFMQ